MRKFNSIEELYLFTKRNIENKRGAIYIQFAGRNVRIDANDIIGNCLQAWLPEWFKYCGVEMIENPETQSFPDFIGVFNGQHHAIEIKCWNYTASPAFDLSNFYSFVEQTYINPTKINADYFILGYTPSPGDSFEEGFIVNKLYHKKIWQITKPSTKYPIGLQVKRGEVYAIRPFAFHKNPDDSFANREEFLKAIKEGLHTFPNPELDFDGDEWFNKVKASFK